MIVFFVGPSVSRRNSVMDGLQKVEGATLLPVARWPLYLVIVGPMPSFGSKGDMCAAKDVRFVLKAEVRLGLLHRLM